MRLALVSLLVGGSLAFADPAVLRIGVFDTRQSGGQGVGPRHAVAALEKAGYNVRTFADFSPLTLAQYDVLWLADMHSAGAQPEGWQQRLEAFVEAGGGVLQTWHHHILGKVGLGVRRVYRSRAMKIVPGEHALTGMKDFSASYGDHIVEQVGAAGTPVIKNEFGDTVLAVGQLGKGRVASTGLALAISRNRPRGAELELLKRLIAWLAPTVPPEDRLGSLGEKPVLQVLPKTRLVAAGFPGRFCFTVSGKGDQAPEILLDGKPCNATLAERLAAADLQLATYTLTIPTAAKVSAETTHALRVRVGDTTLEETLAVQALYVPPVVNERRGVWLHVGNDRHPSKVMPELKTLGLNMAVLRIAGGTAAFYASKVQPDIQDPLAETGGDWLADAVRYAHANGIEIHPYVNNCVVEGRTSKESLERLRQANLLQKSPEGRDIDWFCPSAEENLVSIERPMVEIASNYDIDGIQYDFIRYPNSQGCFCPRCRALFEKETEKTVADWPKDVLKDGKRYDEWVEFRCRRISAIVERVSTKIRQVNPKAKISAAVFRDWPRCRETNGQDWGLWCRKGWLDFVCPMNYTNSDQTFLKNCISHVEAVPKGFPVAQGIGTHSGNSVMDDPGQLLLQIMLARQQGAVGFVGFCYRPEHTTKLCTPLKGLLD